MQVTVNDIEREPSVLLAFRAANARSFRDELELSLLATGFAEQGVARSVRWREGGSPVEVLPAAGIFGANASGKSNVLKLMDDMRHLVLGSFRLGDPTGGVPRRPFLLEDAARRTPTRFEIDLVVEGVRHEYGFSIDDERVLEEWAYRYPKGKPALLFRREGDDVQLGPANRSRGRAILDLLRPNALFLSTAATANHPDLLALFGWFHRNLLLAEVASRPHRQLFTMQMLGDQRRDKVLALLRAADLGIVDVRKRPVDPVLQERMRRAIHILSGLEGEPTEEGPTFEELGLRMVHRGSGGEPVELEDDDESHGTAVWFGLIGPVIDALEQGSVLLADELDASLHPSLVAQVLRLFQNPESNPNRAQLVFYSHEVSLLGDTVRERPLGRDQIWFTEKGHDGATRLYSLVEQRQRKQEAIGRRYLDGRYGAIPIVSGSEFAAAAELIASER